MKGIGLSYFSISNDIHSVPVTIIKPAQTKLTLLVTSINGQFGLSRAVVDSKEWIAILKLQNNEIFRITFTKVHHRSIVKDEATVLASDELQTCVAIFTLRKGLIPGPAVSTEAVSCLLTSWAVKANQAEATKMVDKDNSHRTTIMRKSETHQHLKGKKSEIDNSVVKG